MRDDKNKQEENDSHGQHAGRVSRPRGREPEDESGEGSCSAFGYLRGIRERADAIEIRFQNGNSTWFPYSWLGEWKFNPSDGLLLKFSGDLVYLVLIRGSNLDRPLSDTTTNLTTSGLQRHRIVWMREMSEEEIRQVGELHDARVFECVLEFFPFWSGDMMCFVNKQARAQLRHPSHDVGGTLGYLIGEMLRLACPFDLRLLVNKAFPDYQQWKDGEAESDWRDLITASIEEHLVAVRHSEEPPVSRESRKDEERSILQEIIRDHPSRNDRVRAWIQRTGKSERAFYRRLAEMR